MKMKLALALCLVVSISSSLPAFAANAEIAVMPRTSNAVADTDILRENSNQDTEVTFIAGNESAESIQVVPHQAENIDYIVESDKRWIDVPDTAWDWSDGEYGFDAYCQNSVGTRYKFTGSSEYYVNISESWQYIDGVNQYQDSSVGFTVNCHETFTNEEVADFYVSGTDSIRIRFYNLDPDKSYWFDFGKDKYVMGTSSELSTHGTISID